MSLSQTMPIGDLPLIEWQQVIAEDFNTPVALGGWPGPYAHTWAAYLKGWRDTSGRGAYNPGILSVHDSCLDWYLHADASGTPQVATLCPILPNTPLFKGQLWQSHAYRFKMDALYGYKAAWLLWPDGEGWPYNGEIDFPEASLDKPISLFVHHQAGTSPTDQTEYKSGVLLGGGWHIAQLTWKPSGIEAVLDGKVVGRCTSRIPNVPMHLCLQVETALDGEIPAPGSFGHVLLDWATVYKYAVW